MDGSLSNFKHLDLLDSLNQIQKGVFWNRVPSETENTHLFISTWKSCAKNPAVADKELLSHRLGKRCHRSACQKRTCAKARTRVTLIMASKSQQDNLFHLWLLKTCADALIQHTALKVFSSLKKQAPISTGLLKHLFPALGGLRIKYLVNATSHPYES